MNFYKKNIKIKLYFFAFGIFIILISYVFADIITGEILNNDDEMINLGNIADIENGGSSNIINNTIPTSYENFKYSLVKSQILISINFLKYFIFSH
jgi:hypothetical protein